MKLLHTPNHTKGRATVFTSRWFSRPTLRKDPKPDPLSTKGMHRVTLYALGSNHFGHSALAVVDDFGSLVPVEASQ